MIKSRFFKSILFSLVIFGGIWVLFNRDRVREPGDFVQLIQQKIAATTARFQLPNRGQANASADSNSEQFVSGVIRIASFRLNQQTSASATRQSVELIADICRQYDAICFQQIDVADTNWLERLTNRMNEVGAAGSKHLATGQGELKDDYCFISDHVQNQTSETRSAIVFNRRTIECGQQGAYTIRDPDKILSRQPLVGCFRARGPAPDQAFTFTLVNIKINSNRPDLEIAYLGELYRAIRDDGRLEDDVIIAGDFNSDDRGLERLQVEAGLKWVISNRPTNVQQTKQFDNLMFRESATVEYTGRSGVSDFMRLYNLRLDDALSISDRMPVWAEFSILEGGAPSERQLPGRVAKSLDQNPRQK